MVIVYCILYKFRVCALWVCSIVWNVGACKFSMLHSLFIRYGPVRLEMVFYVL